MNNTKTFIAFHAKDWFYFIFLSLTWGSSYILIKRGLEGYTLWQAATLRLIIAALVLGGFAVRYISQLPKEKYKYIVLSSILSMFLPSYLFCAAEINLSSSITGVLNALTPAFALLIGFAFFQKGLHKFQLIGLMLGFVGTCMLMMLNSSSSFTFNAHALFVILASLSYGLNINIVKSHLKDINPFHLASVAVTISGTFALFVLFATGYKSYIVSTSFNSRPLIALIILGVMGTAVAQVVLNRLIKSTTVAFASSVTYVIPAVAVLWGLIDGEHLGAWQVVGIIAIMSGILVLNGKLKVNFTKESTKNH